MLRISPGMEILPISWRAEAVEGDMVYPFAVQEGTKVTVSLADGQQKPYAIIELEEKQ